MSSFGLALDASSSSSPTSSSVFSFTGPGPQRHHSSSSATVSPSLPPFLLSTRHSASTSEDTSSLFTSVNQGRRKKHSSQLLMPKEPPIELLEGEEQLLWHKFALTMVNGLEKVLHDVHPNLVAEKEALIHLETLLLRLVVKLTCRSSSSSFLSSSSSLALLEDRMAQLFPSPVDKWALEEARLAVSKGKKRCALHLPLDKVNSMLKELGANSNGNSVGSSNTIGNSGHHTLITTNVTSRPDEAVTLFLTAVLEYMAADVLKLVGNYVKNIRHMNITLQDLKVAMCADKVLMNLFQQEHEAHSDRDDSNSQSISEVVREFLVEEKNYLRDLQMITKVFRDILIRDCIGTQEEIDTIFSNVTELLELTTTLITSLEDALEMTEEHQEAPVIGYCFEELAEAEEFDVYDKYARDILSIQCKQTLHMVLKRHAALDALRSRGKGFREAVKFYLPKLLLTPIYHCFQYFNYIELMRKLTPSKEDCDTLSQVSAMLAPLKSKLKQQVSKAGSSAKRKPGDMPSRMGVVRMSRQQNFQRLNELQAKISNWEGKNLATNSSEIVCEGKLRLVDSRRRLSDRHVILCDGMIIICKAVKRSSVSSVNQCELKLREKHLIYQVDVLDVEDSDSECCLFELSPKDQPRLLFKTESEDEKQSWMAVLVMLNTKSMLERLLHVILSNEEKKHPLRFPDSCKYRFAEPDSKENIVFEDNEKPRGLGPNIKGATLVKLVERLTYHVHADPMFVKTFLTTFRSFTTANELLDLLIERFKIPEPDFSGDCCSDSDPESAATMKMRMAQDVKRFRNEYSQVVEIRVLNVIKHWVDQHFDDFERDSELLAKLNAFLASIQTRNMRKWIEVIFKTVQKRQQICEDRDKDIDFLSVFNFDRSPPPLEHHITNKEENWPQLLTYHPVELARQLTLLEFQYYRAVKPSELVDQAWTREDKDKRSPNLLRMVRHTTNFTRYLERMIVDSENIDERVAVFNRILEIMLVLQEHNNFNGVLAITSALNSSAVHRLTLTKDRVSNQMLKALEEASSYIEDHFKLYWEKLRSINPPCVPFFGQYQTHLFFLEEGNRDFLQDTTLINFTKRRKVAEIISEIQQYQNQPYCLQIEPEIRKFLQELDAFPDYSEKEITDYLWRKSSEIEPRISEPSQKRKPMEGKPRWKGLNLRSPGIKTKHSSSKNIPHPLTNLRQSSRHKLPVTVASGSSMEPQAGSDESPLTSPVFKSTSSPQSTPTTPNFAPPHSPPDNEPIKIPIVLPSYNQGINSGAAPHMPPPSQLFAPPPPLPPKPSARRHLPPAPPPTTSASSSPPPLPPRRSHDATQSQVSGPPPPLPQHRSPAVSRSHW